MTQVPGADVVATPDPAADRWSHGPGASGVLGAPAGPAVARCSGNLHHRAGHHRAHLAGVGGPLAARAPLVSSRDRLDLAPDLAGAVAEAGVDPALDGRALQDALRRAIATRRGYCWWDVDHAGWVVTLSSPEEQTFYGRTLEEALAWCLV
jgi:hypothetical protein